MAVRHVPFALRDVDGLSDKEQPDSKGTIGGIWIDLRTPGII